MPRGGGTRQLSQRRAVAALTALLCGCKPEKLAEFTAGGLARAYNVPLPRCEELLARARQRGLL